MTGLHPGFLAFDLRNALLTKLKADHLLLCPSLMDKLIEKKILVLDFGPKMN